MCNFLTPYIADFIFVQIDKIFVFFLFLTVNYKTHLKLKKKILRRINLDFITEILGS